MPRQQVYGKRSRAIYDPFAIFASPPRSTPEPTEVKDGGEAAVNKLIDQVEELKLYEDARRDDRGQRRAALGERNANSRVKPEVEKLEKKSRRRVKRFVQEDKVEDVPAPGVKEAEEEVEVPPLDGPEQEDVEVDKEYERPEEAEAHERGDDEPLRDLVRDTTNDEPTINHQDPVAQPAPLPPSASPELLVKNVYTEHTAPLLTLSTHPLTPFTTWTTQLATHFNLTKIAEASFGEVYRLSLLPTTNIPTISRADESVFKVIALSPPSSTLPKDKKKRKAALKKAEAMSKPEDVANEVRLLQRMSSIPGFTNFRDVRLLQGRPPSLFCSAFEIYNTSQRERGKDESIFPDPAKKTSYADEQLWAVIEMQDAGTDLERLIEAGECSSIWHVWDIFWQVVVTLAKGEEAVGFEHRDLHAGNICVRTSPSPHTATTVTAKGEGLVSSVGNGGKGGRKKKLGFTNTETTIIDYTISRCGSTYQDPDPGLFEGDSTEEYQYEIYRFMRDAVVASSTPTASAHTAATAAATNTTTTDADRTKNGNSVWKDYHPVTNLLWLHYILHLLLEQLDWPSSNLPKNKKAGGKKRSAEWKRAVDLEHHLLRVQDLLDPAILCLPAGAEGEGGVRSAGQLVGLALGEGWLDIEDVVGETDEAGDGEEKEVEEEGEEDLTETMRELKLNVDLIEECGVEVAEKEAKASRWTGRRK